MAHSARQEESDCMMLTVTHLLWKHYGAVAYPPHWGVEVRVKGRPGRLQGGAGRRGSPLACHSSCTTAWPATLSGFSTMGGLGLTIWAVILLLPTPSSPCGGGGRRSVRGQKESKHTGQALVLHWDLQSSLLEAAWLWISTLFLLKLRILAFLPQSKPWQNLQKIISFSKHTLQLSRIIKW